jgi:predicted acyltransferase
MVWSSTFVVLVGAYSVLMFALFYYIIDVKNHRGWILFFVVIGMNSITIYLAQHFINFQYISNRVFGGLIGMTSESVQPFLNAAGYVAMCWLFLYFLYKKKVFLKV